MSDTKIEELQRDVKELQDIISSATRPKVKEVLTIELRKLETELLVLNAQEKNIASETFQTKSSVSAPKCYEVKLTNYAWDQSDKFVKIFVTLKNVEALEPELIFCKFYPRGMELFVKSLDNRNYTLPITNLLENIDESRSHWRVKEGMVIVYLAKSRTRQWAHLTASDQKSKEPKVPNIDPDEDPSAGLMNLMKKMYEDGDDEMKRTIAKAWTESREKNMNSF